MGLVGVFFYREYTAPPPQQLEPQMIVRNQEQLPFAAESAEAQEETPDEEARHDGLVYEVGSLRTFEDRLDYRSGDLELYVPKLGFQGPVADSVEESVLQQGVGLFQQAQLPGPDEGHNSNTSIAGDRQLNGKEFYYLDTLEDGDQIYLRYQDILYTYTVVETLVEYADNWDPMRVREYACVTLQAEHPLGSEAYNRIYKVGRLTAVAPGAAFPDSTDAPGIPAVSQDAGDESAAAQGTEDTSAPEESGGAETV